jgi:hypothetical protein
MNRKIFPTVTGSTPVCNSLPKPIPTPSQKTTILQPRDSEKLMRAERLISDEKLRSAADFVKHLPPDIPFNTPTAIAFE